MAAGGSCANSAQLLGQVGDLLGQRRDLGQEQRDLRLKLDDPRVLRGDGGFELSDPLLRVQRPT